MSVLSAQEVRGTFTGTVADPQGAIIVGAKVVARNLAIGSVTESFTNKTGLFVAPFLRKGKYQITASNGQVIDTAKVKDLPLLGRNPFLSAAISTGVQYSPTRGFKKFAVTERVNVEFRAESFNITNTPWFGTSRSAAFIFTLNQDKPSELWISCCQLASSPIAQQTHRTKGMPVLYGMVGGARVYLRRGGRRARWCNITMKVAYENAVMPNSAQSLTQPLWNFSFLQLLDFLTTVAFLVNGVGEANPVVRAMMLYAPNPLLGLAVVKLVAVVLAIVCWRSGRFQVVDRMNLFFAVVVTWNLTALIMATARG